MIKAIKKNLIKHRQRFSLITKTCTLLGYLCLNLSFQYTLINKEPFTTKDLYLGLVILIMSGDVLQILRKC